MIIHIQHLADNTDMVSGKKLFVKSYGCQMNMYDAMRLSDLMKPHGYHLVQNVDDADLVILNTCHIREKADAKVFSDIGRMKRALSDDGVIAVGGCVGQAMGKEIIKRARGDVKIVFGPQTLHRLPEYVAQVNRGRKNVVDVDFPALEKFDNLPAPRADGVTAFVSIQEGCDKFCTYCVVPYTRGPELSRPFQDIYDEVRHLCDTQGVKEVTLLGQNVNAYAYTLESGEEVSFAKLIEKLSAIDGLKRLRFTTSHQNNMTAELIDLFKTQSKLMPYLHLPVQAGSDKILHAMNRNHTAQGYLEIIEQVREARPDIAISGDFIVGFPGETEEDYIQTLEIIAAVGYQSAFSFAYSARPGTPAANLPNHVEPTVQKERLAGLQALIDSQQIEFNEQFVGQTVEVLVEERGPSGDMRGRSPHNIAVTFAGEVSQIGELIMVKIDGTRAKSLYGQQV